MQKIKASGLKGMQFHHQRERESNTNPDIDHERSDENYDLANERNIDYNKRVKEIIESQKTSTRKTRKDAVLVNELLITSDEDFFKKLTRGEQNRFFEESYDLFARRYGKQNVAYARVHLDEKTPHMHLGIVPMREGRLQSKNVFNRQELRWIQDEFPKHMQGLGYKLQRGEIGSAREHIKTQDLKKQTIKKEIDSLERSLSEKKNELLEMSSSVPNKFQIKAKKEKKTVFEDKLVTFGKPKTTEKDTGNLVITPDEFKKMSNAVNSAIRIKADYERLQSTDLVLENKRLVQEKENDRMEYNELVREFNTNAEDYNELRKENKSLKRHISNLKQDISLIYESTREFLKERTDGLKAFKNVFKDLVDKVKGKTMDFQEKNDITLERKNEFEKIHDRELKKERNKNHEMEL